MAFLGTKPTCAVCSTTVRGAGKSHTLFEFPWKSKKSVQSWTKAVKKLGSLPASWYPRVDSCVCELHFTDSEVVLLHSGSLGLVFGACPSKPAPLTRPNSSSRKRAFQMLTPPNSPVSCKSQQDSDTEKLHALTEQLSQLLSPSNKLVTRKRTHADMDQDIIEYESFTPPRCSTPITPSSDKCSLPQPPVCMKRPRRRRSTSLAECERGTGSKHVKRVLDFQGYSFAAPERPSTPVPPQQVLKAIVRPLPVRMEPEVQYIQKTTSSDADLKHHEHKCPGSELPLEEVFRAILQRFTYALRLFRMGKVLYALSEARSIQAKLQAMGWAHSKIYTLVTESFVPKCLKYIQKR